MLPVSVCSGYHSKHHRLDNWNNKIFFSHSSEERNIQVQDAGQFGSWWVISPGLEDVHLLTVSSRDRWGRGVPSLSLLKGALPHQIWAPALWPLCHFFFFYSKITADGDCSHEIKRHLLLGRKVMINLDSILKSRDIILQQRSI